MLGDEHSPLLRESVPLLHVPVPLLSLDSVEGALSLLPEHPGLLVRHVGGELVPGGGNGGAEPAVGSGGAERSELGSDCII